MINCTITSTKETKVYQNVQSIILPAYSGQLQLLPGHTEAFILLQTGKIILKRVHKQDELVQITKGECYAKNDLVSIIL